MAKVVTESTAETGIVGMVEIDTVGTAETDIVGTAEIGAESMAKTGATGAAGEVAMGIFVSAATSGSLKVFAIKGTDMQSKGKTASEGYTDVYIYI